MDYVAVFGIGSTNFRSAVADTDGTVHTDVSVESTRQRALPTQLVDAVDRLAAASPHALDAVAVSCTGLVDAAAGEIRDLDTPGGATLGPVDVAGPVEAAHDLPVSLANDCNAAALGEWYYGARTDHDCLAHVTVGTGIGGGVVERGRLVRGDAGQAGEFGLLPVAPRAFESTGVAGAWEAVCSGRGIPQYVADRVESVNDADRVESVNDADRSGSVDDADRTASAGGTGHAAPEGGTGHVAPEGGTGHDTSDAGSPVGEEPDTGTRARFADPETFSAEDVFAAADAGDAFARSCLAEVAEYNAAGIGAVCNAVNPGLVTLGGGVAMHNPEWIVDGIESSLDRYCFVDPPAIRLSPLGDDVGLYGALATYLARSDEPALDATTRAARSETD